MSGLVVRQGKVSENNNEQGISYDLMGNLTGLNRTGVFTHSLAYAYTGNQLTTITNSGAAFRSYGYDANGNATSDGQGNAISYNMLNPPQSIPGKGLTYTYDAAGTKLRKVSGTTTTEYISGIQYTGTAIDFVQTEEGRAINSGGSYTYEYNLADHLGNTRLSLNQNGVTKQQDDYYPFGLEINRGTTSPKNEYLYNKKELQEETGLYDYGARFYDPIIARWTAVDPMAEMGRRWSPYIYGFNNPMRFTDPDGMWPDGPGDDEHGTGNDMSLVENVIYSTRDMVTSGVATLVSGIKSLFGGEPMKEASFTYSGGQRTLSYSPLTSTTDKLAATGNAFLGIASIVPVDGPAAGIFAKASGVKSSVATIVKEAIHANSKASTLENTLYHLNQNGVTKQQDDYYPFGLEINRSTTSPKNEYLYNKKELQEETGYYDYGARFYDPVIARWTTVDPLAEKSRRFSPYVYGNNNPIRFIDPDGMEAEEADDDDPHVAPAFSSGARMFWAKVFHPLAAIAIGPPTRGFSNISANSERFATSGSSDDSGSVLGGGQEGAGTESNAFRHSLWQATITSQFGADVAQSFGDAHENNPNADLSQRTFTGKNALNDADMHVDLLNNQIGRQIGASSEGQGMNAIAGKVLNQFAKTGLWTATKQKDGSYKISLSKITSKQFKALQSRFGQLNNNGRTAAGQAKVDEANGKAELEQQQAAHNPPVM